MFINFYHYFKGHVPYLLEQLRIFSFFMDLYDLSMFSKGGMNEVISFRLVGGYKMKGSSCIS